MSLAPVVPNLDSSHPTTSAGPWGPLPRGYIRLLKLEGLEVVLDDALPSIAVKCSLIQSPLKIPGTRRTNMEYQALSYVWGSVTPSKWIVCDGHRLPITHNLHGALEQLTRSSYTGLLWVDAICINQEDRNEKPQQILIMGEVYSLASKVIVWLGTGSGSVGGDLECFWRASKDGDTEELLNDMQVRTAGLEHINNSPWLKRMWTFQEVILARAVTIWLGPWTLDLDLLLDLQSLQAEFDDPGPSVVGVEPRDRYQSLHALAEVLLDSWHDGGRLSLSSLLEATRDRQCREPRDKFFAIAGLWRKRPPIPVSYHDSILRIYAATAINVALEDCDFSILTLGEEPCNYEWTEDDFQSVQDYQDCLCPYHHPQLQPNKLWREDTPVSSKRWGDEAKESVPETWIPDLSKMTTKQFRIKNRAHEQHKRNPIFNIPMRLRLQGTRLKIKGFLVCRVWRPMDGSTVACFYRIPNCMHHLSIQMRIKLKRENLHIRATSNIPRYYSVAKVAAAFSRHEAAMCCTKFLRTPEQDSQGSSPVSLTWVCLVPGFNSPMPLRLGYDTSTSQPGLGLWPWRFASNHHFTEHSADNELHSFLGDEFLAIPVRLDIFGDMNHWTPSLNYEPKHGWTETLSELDSAFPNSSVRQRRNYIPRIDFRPRWSALDDLFELFENRKRIPTTFAGIKITISPPNPPD